MNFNEAFEIWYNAESPADITREVVQAIKEKYLDMRPAMYDSQDLFLNWTTAYENISQVLYGLTIYRNSPAVMLESEYGDNLISFYFGTSNLKNQHALMDLVHPESKVYGVKFIRWIAKIIKNHRQGRDLFYDPLTAPFPSEVADPCLRKECESRDGGWYCTKDLGHAGDHEAVGYRVRWPQDVDQAARLSESMHAPGCTTPFDNIIIVHECKVPWYNRISIPMKIWKDQMMQQRHHKGEKIRITIERI